MHREVSALVLVGVCFCLIAAGQAEPTRCVDKSGDCASSDAADGADGADADAASLLQGKPSISTDSGLPRHVRHTSNIQRTLPRMSDKVDSSLLAKSLRSLTQELTLFSFVYEPHMPAEALDKPLQNGFRSHSKTVLLLDSERWTLLCMCAMMCSALFLYWIKLQKTTLLSIVMLWGTSTIAMNIANKIALKVIPLPLTLVIVQMFIALVLLCVMFGPIVMIKEILAHREVAATWGMLSVFFAAGLTTSLLALNAGSVTFILILRNLMPLFSLVAERQLLPLASTRPVTLEGLSALVLLFAGTVLYAKVELNVGNAWKSLGWIILNMVIMVSYRLIERRLLWDMPTSLSFGSLSFLQNACALPLVLVLFFAGGEYHLLAAHEEILTLTNWRDPLSSVCILFSGCAGLSLGYFSVVLQKQVTATTMLALQSCFKVLIIVVAMVVLGDQLSFWSATGCIISLLGGVWYAWTASRPEGEGVIKNVDEIKCP